MMKKILKGEPLKEALIWWWMLFRYEVWNGDVLLMCGWWELMKGWLWDGTLMFQGWMIWLQCWWWDGDVYVGDDTRVFVLERWWRVAAWWSYSVDDVKIEKSTHKSWWMVMILFIFFLMVGSTWLMYWKWKETYTKDCKQNWKCRTLKQFIDVDNVEWEWEGCGECLLEYFWDNDCCWIGMLMFHGCNVEWCRIGSLMFHEELMWYWWLWNWNADLPSLLLISVNDHVRHLRCLYMIIHKVLQ